MIKPHMEINRHGFFAILLLSMAACGSAPARLPAAVDQANKADQAAHRALRDGDLMRARELFGQSMLIQQSLENIPASAMAAINLSSVNHKLGETGAALGLLDGVLADHAPLVPVELRAAAEFRKGVILTDNSQFDAANSALQLALQLCNNQCVLMPGINNLRARLTFEKQDYAATLEIVESVLKEGADKEEKANALRLAGAAEYALGQHQTALDHYNAALQLDKLLALSGRIVEDLKGASKSLEKLGRLAEAAEYAKRAEVAVSSARLLNENTMKKTAP